MQLADHSALLPKARSGDIVRRLDEAVFAAYGWSPTISDDDLLAKLLELNLQRAAEPTN